jgi:hypothetical protein
VKEFKTKKINTEHTLELSSENDVVEKLFAEYEKKSIRKFIEDGGKIKVFPYVISFIFFTTKKYYETETSLSGQKYYYPTNLAIRNNIHIWLVVDKGYHLDI